jgi:hypothetical protein
MDLILKEIKNINIFKLMIINGLKEIFSSIDTYVMIAKMEGLIL